MHKLINTHIFGTFSEFGQNPYELCRFFIILRRFFNRISASSFAPNLNIGERITASSGMS